MRDLRGFLLTAIFSLSIGTAQAGLPDSLQGRNVQYLANLCKVWGVYKYYHPKVVRNEINWEEQLIRVLPRVYKAENTDDYQQQVGQLIENAGTPDFSGNEPEVLEDYAVSDYHNLQFSWMDNAGLLAAQHRSTLRAVVDSFVPQPNASLEAQLEKKLEWTDNRVKRVADKADKEPRTNQRLADLFTLWNHFVYFFPYKEKQPVEEEQLLMKYIPRFYQSDSRQEYHLQVQAFLAEMRDSRAFSNSGFVLDYLGRYSVPLTLIHLDDTTYVKSVRQRLQNDWDIRPGHRLVSVNGTPVDSLRDKLRSFVPAAHRGVRQYKVNRFLIAADKYSSANLKFADKHDATYQASLTRDYPMFKKAAPIHKEKPSTKYLNDSTAYLDVDRIAQDKVKDALSNVDESDYLIIDVRSDNNKTIEALEEFFTPEKQVVQYFHYPLTLYPGKFYTEERENAYSMFKGAYEGEVVFLINAQCSGGCELTVDAIRKSRDDVTLIGQPTAGAFGAARNIELPFGSTNIMYTGTRVTNESGQHPYPNGLQPDKTVTWDKEKVRSGKDPYIQKALKFINK
jgi:hypothetical protein